MTQTGFELTGLQPNTAYSATVLAFANDGTIHIIGAVGFTTQPAP